MGEDGEEPRFIAPEPISAEVLAWMDGMIAKVPPFESYGIPARLLCGRPTSRPPRFW
jgi:hypothetical protein